MIRGASRVPLAAVVAVLAVVSLAAPLGAQPSLRPLGGEFQVNDRTPYDQFRPAVATNPQGRTFVVWSDIALARLYGRLLDASGQPLSGDLWIDDWPSQNPNRAFNPYFHRARVAAGPDGQFVVTWDSYQAGILIRRFDADGQPLSAPVSIRNEPGEWPGGPDIAFDRAGNFFVTWISAAGSTALPSLVMVQKFDASGKPLAGAYRNDQGETFYKNHPRLALDPATGDGLVVWIDEREFGNPDVWGRRFTSSGQPLDSEFLVNSNKDGEAIGAVPVFHADGGFSVVWSNYLAGGLPIVAQRFDAEGARVGSEVVLSEEGTDLYPPAVATAPDGGVLVLWPGVDQRGPDRAVLGRFFDSSWRPRGAMFQVNTYVQWDQTEPAVAGDGRGNFVAVWSSGEQQFPRTPPGLYEWGGQDGSSYGVFGQRLSFAGCSAGADRLCLGPGGRFQVRVDWKNPFTGETGIGHSHPLTADTGAFWFFGQDNLELLIKVLDGRTSSGHFWVYYGALSDVEYTITVTDTATGRERTYGNPAGQFASRADVSAFPEAASSLPAPAAAPSLAPHPEPTHPLPHGCTPAAAVLCLAGNRFAVEVSFTDPRTGIPSQGRAVPLTADTGVFWFFGPDNLELMIKVLDARVVNGRFWVYFGALSDVAYTITVTDTETGQRRTYRNDRGRLASRADIEAFPAGGN